jgi:hypothetical protein
MSTIACEVYCSECGASGKTGMRKVWCDCKCPNCNTIHASASDVGWEDIVCPECKGTGKKPDGERCRNCVGGRRRQSCSTCRGSGRDPNCPKCKGDAWTTCWCTLSGLRSVKHVDLTELLPSLLEVGNSINFYNKETPQADHTGPAHVLSLAQIVRAVGREGVKLSGHECAEGTCKVNWLRPELAQSAGHSMSCVRLSPLRSSQSASGWEVRRVGPDRYIYIGSCSYGEQHFNWDAGREALEQKTR